MDFAIQQQFNKKQLQLINNCRLYLQIVTLAEIVTNDGKQILQYYTKPNSKANLDANANQWSTSTYRCPQQNMPNNKAWRVWKQLLNGITDPLTKDLKQPMGQWIQRTKNRISIEYKPLLLHHHDVQYAKCQLPIACTCKSTIVLGRETMFSPSSLL